MEDLLQQLNESQRAAVEFCDGPSLVIAGAGSGKTRVLTYKIAYLLKLGLPPQNILALTFTNKAAREMRERVGQLVGEHVARRLWMGTFHSIFSRILRAEAERIGFGATYTITDSADSRNLIKTIIKEMQLDDKLYKPGMVQAVVSRAKNALVSPAMYAQNKEVLEHDARAKVPQIKDIYREYNRRLKASNMMDFDDLLFYTNRLFLDNPEVLKTYQERFQYILVDEYQDTNRSQYQIVSQLAALHHRICVVGDDAQSIYAFRGANIDNILQFSGEYTNAQTFKLERNYRSTQNIVNAASSLISRNVEQIRKKIYSENEEGEKLELSSAFSDFEEGLIVANKIQELRRQKQEPYSDFVILYRTNAQSRIFEESLRKRNIPYRIYGGLSFYQRKEIKDVIAYFRLVVNPNDEEALKRIINFPTRGIGQTTLSKVAEAARLHNTSLWQVVSNPLAFNLNINAGTGRKLADFRELIDSFMQQLQELSAYEMASLIVKQSGIAREAYQDNTPEGMSRQENLQELLGGINEFCETRREEGEEQIGLMDFLAEVSLLTDQDTDKESGHEKVTMMTIHASKGLEFKNVFIVGLEEDLFPSSMAKSETRGLEEERRLFYVAITRAKEFCMLTYAKSRFRNGQTNPCNPSRFLREIDTSFLNISAGALSGGFSSANGNGFWDNVRRQREERESSTPIRNYESNPKPVSTPPPSKMVSVRHATPKLSAQTGVADVPVGAMIEHERFGIGKVLSVEGAAESRKATVEFQNAGTKQLLLKFARFKIIT
ncbi:DNA helicase-2/ATP-dependent DNA helicase PcrA [Dysgonomonas sp. PH5-45]|uniref:ATP-dependent helicase n=1 Tax=unclassified Dysgonomonas TaxID=2630389 RepID=UPI002476C42A|nr:MULTISPECIES: UvrD-helicase domain-containing protein [unclassified Dysgonomonas]MDH6355394.1 DNA helicase-2/ATP-dependent DNA helicase PcrA [Dysgonomonas sp. PH5-45]MDH6388292.1 DNA helicase-2/ATP-dependent DNA helicase PcrA [Dysgonomonas sp. PH5-37]